MRTVPFTERNSRILIFCKDNVLQLKLAESWSEDNAPLFAEWEFLDEQGSALEIDNMTSMPYRVDIDTASGQFSLAFIDHEALCVRMPPGRCGVCMLLPGHAIELDRRGAVIQYQDAKPLCISYTCDTRFAKHSMNPRKDSEWHKHVILLSETTEHPSFTFHITRTTRRNRYVPDFDRLVEAAKRRWEHWFSAAPDVSETYREQYYFAWWVLAVGLVHSYYHPYREGMVPSKLGYVGIWNWDSYFHAIAFRHIDPELAKNQLRILLDHQLNNGMLPDVVYDDGVLSHTSDYGIDSDITKPPLTAWAIWRVYAQDGDIAFLQEVYDALVRSQLWWFAERASGDTGFCEYIHPYSSGWDNNPVFDERLPIESPDLTAYLILQYDHLAKIAEAIGMLAESARWEAEAKDLIAKYIDSRWDAEAGLFWPMRKGQPVRISTPLSLMPLVTGRLPTTIADCLVGHLMDEQSFWTEYPVPTVAVNDPRHDPVTMWRGPVWININYLLIDGLQRSGYEEESRRLRQKTLELVNKRHDIYEYYHPRTGEKPPASVNMFGWSAALFIDLVLQEMKDTATEA